MQVFVSAKASGKHKVYHLRGCRYEKRIKTENKMCLGSASAKKYGYVECKCCSGLGGIAHAHKHFLEKMEKDCGIMTFFDRKTETLYISTDIGGWKIFGIGDRGYALKHMNHFTPEMSFDEMRRAKYHCQRDVKPTYQVDELVKYIVRHDRAKKIIADDYRKLPKATKKQKKYYRQAENRKRRKEKRSLYATFTRLEKKDPSLKQVSITGWIGD